MKEDLSKVIDQLIVLRSRAFNERLEEVHTQLGRAVSNLIRAKEGLNQ